MLFDMVTEEGPDGKTVKVKRQVRYNAFVYADEGEVLAATARRNTTSTLLPHLRSIFSGAVLGQANASEERKRRVPAGKYSYGVVIALQPTKAGPRPVWSGHRGLMVRRELEGDTGCGVVLGDHDPFIGAVSDR